MPTERRAIRFFTNRTPSRTTFSSTAVRSATRKLSEITAGKSWMKTPSTTR